jgi:tRNA A37 threonylcarbamoyladenosine biosynthesis protein TsaE
MQAREEYGRNARVIARTARGLEVGEVLCAADGNAVSQLVEPPGGSIQREMTNEDRLELAHLYGKLDEESDTCIRIIRELGLEMDLVEIERIFGGERMVIYYLAEGRIDFRELVTSPTYVLVQRYAGSLTMYHLDFYRLKSIEEVWDLGIDEWLAEPAVTVIEWADKFPAALPDEVLRCNLSLEADGRRLASFTAGAPRAQSVLERVSAAFE